jgi:hypothetical protein
MTISLRVPALATAMCALAVWEAQAQQRPITRADSIEKARADSIALVKALEAATARPSTGQPQPGPSGPSNPRLLPDISAVGDFVGDFSPKGSTQDDLSRFGVREVELAFQAAVDPYFRGDIFLGLSDLEGVSIEQAYLTATAIPDLELRLGRYLMPFGKQNTTHRHDLHTVEYPWVIRQYLNSDGLKGTGIYASKVFAPFGWYQELIVTAVDRLGEAPSGLHTVEPVNKELGGLGYSARLRNYWDVNESTNLELSGSAMTGRLEQPLLGVVADAPNAFAARQSTIGADLTFRWRPLQQGLYKSFLLQSEVMRQVNELVGSELPRNITYAGPVRDATGGYVFARYQLTQRLFISGRGDYVQDALIPDGTLKAGSGYLEWFPSEFSKFIAGYERVSQTGLEGLNRLLVQASFALGPHKPHPF